MYVVQQWSRFSVFYFPGMQHAMNKILRVMASPVNVPHHSKLQVHCIFASDGIWRSSFYVKNTTPVTDGFWERTKLLKLTLTGMTMTDLRLTLDKYITGWQCGQQTDWVTYPLQKSEDFIITKSSRIYTYNLGSEVRSYLNHSSHFSIPRFEKERKQADRAFGRKCIRLENKSWQKAKSNWTLLNCHFLGFYQTNLDEILHLLLTSPFYIEILKPISHWRDLT